MKSNLMFIGSAFIFWCTTAANETWEHSKANVNSDRVAEEITIPEKKNQDSKLTMIDFQYTFYTTFNITCSGTFSTAGFADRICYLKVFFGARKYFHIRKFISFPILDDTASPVLSSPYLAIKLQGSHEHSYISVRRRLDGLDNSQTEFEEYPWSHIKVMTLDQSGRIDWRSNMHFQRNSRNMSRWSAEKNTDQCLWKRSTRHDFPFVVGKNLLTCRKTMRSCSWSFWVHFCTSSQMNVLIIFVGNYFQTFKNTIHNLFLIIDNLLCRVCWQTTVAKMARDATNLYCMYLLHYLSTRKKKHR